MVLVSVVVPCHNEEDTIGRCLSSIFNAELLDGVTGEVVVVIHAR